MKKKSYLTLDDEFIMYCELNNIQDIEKLAKETFNRGFTLLKYGETPKIDKKEVIKKWEESELLNGLKPAKKKKAFKIMEPNPNQTITPIVKEEKDLYDE
jgi:hypothetical protein